MSCDRFVSIVYRFEITFKDPLFNWLEILMFRLFTDYRLSTTR